MKLISTDFSQGQEIPLKFTCDGENVPPTLRWVGFPPQTESFALSCIDRDSKAGTWKHWLIVNIPPAVHDVSSQKEIVGDELENDFGEKGYGGPCPEKGEHRYFFTVYALDVPELRDVNKENFEKRVKEHKIVSAELMSKYKRN